MATATKQTETTVHLTLTESEAKTLRQILASVGYLSQDQPQNHKNALSVSNALADLGYHFIGLNHSEFPFDRSNRSLMFIA